MYNFKKKFFKFYNFFLKKNSTKNKHIIDFPWLIKININY